MDEFAIHIGPKRNRITITIPDGFGGANSTVGGGRLCNRCTLLDVVVGFIGEDRETQDTRFLNQTFDPINFLLLDFRNDDFDLSLTVGPNLDLLRAAWIDPSG